MIYAYGARLPGPYHIKNDIVCQDYFEINKVGKEACIAAVADGLGSAKYSDEGSKIAATEAVKLCSSHINAQTTDEEILNIIRSSFYAAQRAIEQESRSKDRPVELYDTTLTLAILIGETLYFGHSGDSGMIALATDGRYIAVTKQQRDEEGRVFPLFFSDKWEFGIFEHRVASVLLATDGMFEVFFPMYIKNDPVNIHVSLAEFFMNNKTLRIQKVGEQELSEGMSKFMENIPEHQVDDDKTIVTLINTRIKPKRQPKEYYAEPDWAELKRQHDEEWRRQAYPGLYKNEQKPQAATPGSVKQTGIKSIAPRRIAGRRINYLAIVIAAVVFVSAISVTAVLLLGNGQGGPANENYEANGYNDYPLFGVPAPDEVVNEATPSPEPTPEPEYQPEPEPTPSPTPTPSPEPIETPEATPEPDPEPTPPTPTPRPPAPVPPAPPPLPPPLSGYEDDYDEVYGDGYDEDYSDEDGDEDGDEYYDDIDETSDCENNDGDGDGDSDENSI